MKRYFSATILATMPFLSSGDANATVSVGYTCSGGDERLADYVVCELKSSPNAGQDVTVSDGYQIECLCPGDSTKYVQYSCSVNGQCVGCGEWTGSTCYSRTCTAGTYLDDAGECHSCISATGDDMATSNNGAVGVNECYVPADSLRTGNGGQFMFVNDCYYEGEAIDDDTGTETSSTTTTGA